MMFYFFQAEYGNLLTGVAVAVVTGISTYLIVKWKNSGDATKALTESCEMLARQAQAAYAEIPIFRTKIRELETINVQLAENAERLKANVQAYKQKLEDMQADAELVIEEISNLAFIPTGPPTEADETAIKRLKNMRDAAGRMSSII